MMDNIDDSENNAKVSDSGYSNSCSNSQTRSHSSKSTHSGSHSSGSSGYGGGHGGGHTGSNSGGHSTSHGGLSGGHGTKPSSCSNVTTEPMDKHIRTKEKETKHKNQMLKVEEETTITNRLDNVSEEKHDQDDDGYTEMVINAPSIPSDIHAEVESMDISTCGSIQNYAELPLFINSPQSCKSTHTNKGPSTCSGFTCVISMHDGVVMYTTPTLTAALDYPRDMWIGRSFIDFLHPRDRSTFASQITNSLAVPKIGHGVRSEDETPQNFKSKMFCRIRKYRSLNLSFGVREKEVVHVPFLLMLSFKNISDDKGKMIYLVIQAIPFNSAFKVPNEVLSDPIAFVLRHSASGKIEYIDPESVPYLGYLPQDLADKDALNLYHPDDMDYIQHVYEELVRKDVVKDPRPFRMLCRNGEYLKLSTEWSAVINPWSRKLEYVIGKHTVVEGPPNPCVFRLVENESTLNMCDSDKPMSNHRRDNILRVMNAVLTKPAELARETISKRCETLMSFMENIVDDKPVKPKCDELRSSFSHETDTNRTRESGILEVLSPQVVSKASTETRMSYTQLNYYETLQRYFDSYQNFIQKAEEEKRANASAAGQNKDSKMSMTKNSSAPKEYSPTEFTDNARGCERKLTALQLTRHNVKMEKELSKKIRESRTTVKTDRQKVFNEHKQKKKEHIARCNAAYIPTPAETSGENQPNKLKRLTEETEDDTANTSKHEGITHRRKRQKGSSYAVHATRIPPPPPPVVNPDRFDPARHVLSVPMYYVPTNSTVHHNHNCNTQNQDSNYDKKPQHSVQYLTYLQAAFGSAIVYSPIGPQTPFAIPQNIVLEQSCTMSQKSIGLTQSNYIEACTQHTPPVTILRRSYKHRVSHDYPQLSYKLDEISGGSSSELSLKRQQNNGSNDGSYRNSLKLPSSRTDGESSYSSFYSSFFKTESGSDSDNVSKQRIQRWEIERSARVTTDESAEKRDSYLVRIPTKKPEPPWMEKINVTPDFIFKYQIQTKSLDDALREDKQLMEKMEQPSLVNEQMRQLFLDLQLEGSPAKLTLEEGTSSSSSGEETTDNNKLLRRKRQYTTTAIVYEENAPFPPSPAEEIQDEPMENA